MRDLDGRRSREVGCRKLGRDGVVVHHAGRSLGHRERERKTSE
jgi:hypothetical protein